VLFTGAKDSMAMVLHHTTTCDAVITACNGFMQLGMHDVMYCMQWIHEGYML
jgi:hypothetical protein